MSRLASLFQAILDDPDDDALRLIYADCLEEDGRTARAEFIRVQVALARTPEQDSRLSMLRDRERLLFTTHADDLYSGLPDWVREVERGQPPTSTFSRGFVEHVTTSASRFAQDGEALACLMPLLSARLRGDTPEDWQSLAATPALSRLRRLRLETEPRGRQNAEGELAPFFASPYLHGLRELDLTLWQLDEPDVRAIFRAGVFPNLRVLNLTCCGLGDGQLGPLNGPWSCPGLEVLDLSSNELREEIPLLALAPATLHTLRLDACALGDTGVRALAASSLFGRLRELRLAQNDIRDEGIRALAHSLPASLAHLDLGENPIDRDALAELQAAAVRTGCRLETDTMTLGDEELLAQAESGEWAQTDLLDQPDGNISDAGARILARCPHLLTLTALYLEGNVIGPQGVERLAHSPYLEGLSTLDLGANPIGDTGVTALVQGGLHGLFALHLSHAGLTDRGITELWQAPFLSSLALLDVAHNQITAGGLQAFVSANFPELTDLDLSGNRLGIAGGQVLAGWPGLARLRRLVVRDCELGTEGVRAILESPFYRPSLALEVGNDRAEAALVQAHTPPRRERTQLLLPTYNLGDEGLRTLLAAPHLGSPTQVDLTLNGLSAAGAALLAAHPILQTVQRLVLSDNPIRAEGLAALLGSPRLTALRALELRNCKLDDSCAELLSRWRGLATLEYCLLTDNPLSEAGRAALYRSPYLGNDLSLRFHEHPDENEAIRYLSENPALLGWDHLHRSSAGLDVEGVARLAASPYAVNLTRLDLSGNRLGDESVRLLASSPSITRLTSLNLAATGVTASGLAALRDSSNFRQLRELNLNDNPLGDAGAQQLAAANLPQLVELRLTNTGIGPTGAASLAASPTFAALRHLALDGNPLGDAGVAALARSPHLQSLESLDLRSCRIINASAEGILAPAVWPRLRRLVLAGNSFSSSGEDRLRERFGVGLIL
jgi:uncharacterized protein (TIGR02996 family)